MRTLSQKRSEFALEKVLEYIDKLSDKEKKEFASFVSGTPTQILQNGFGQALAFWLSKSQKKHVFILDTIREWLSLKKDDIENNFIRRCDDNKKLIEQISKLDQTDYLSAQKETLKLLEWVKRYAQAFKGDEKDDTNS